MAGRDAEHVYYSSRHQPHHHRRHSSQPSNPSFHDDHPQSLPPCTSSSPALSILPATRSARSASVTSRPPPLSLSTTKDHDPHDDTARESPPSPDPHEYYRRCRDPFGAAQNDFLSGAGVLPVGPDSGMLAATYPRKASVSSVRSDGSRSPRSPPSPEFPRQFRSTSGTATNGFGQGSLRPESALSAQARSRQSSLKELVDKFNRTVDEVPPVPSGASSRVASRAVSLTEGTGGYPRPPAPSLSKSGTSQQERQDWPAQRREPDVRSARRDSTGSTSSCSGPGQSVSGEANGTAGGQSAVHLNGPSQAPRRPLFGELLVVDTAVANPGYGIASHPRRRGSDGSVNCPSPRFLDRELDRSAGVSPSSPTAWYLGYTQSLEAVNTDTKPRNHRRVRSDVFWNSSNPTLASSLNTQMAVAAPFQPASAASPGTPHGKSRIPISTHRRSNTSDSGSSSPTKPDSATGSRPSSSQVSLPPKGTSLLPKPSKSPTRSTHALAPLDLTRDTAHGPARQPQPEKSPRLQAYISAPPPKKSPPLRSSRPRQPVSTATATTSRARVVERVSNLQNQNANDRDDRNSRPRTRKLPELNNVDFAARRQKIQQAFNRTVQENARREQEAAELRRRAKAKEEEEEEEEQKRAKAKEEEQRKKEAQAASLSGKEADDRLCGSVDGGHALGKFETPEEHPSLVPPRLTVDTTSATQPQENVAAGHQTRSDAGDSPTLGLADERRSLHGMGRPDTRSSDIAPPSAVTAGTNDTDITSFDPEPQVELLQPTTSHRTVLSQIMQMRESSPGSSTSCGDHDCDFSDDDDGKESIRIMLRDSTYFDDSAECSDSQERHEVYERHDHLTIGQENRWSISTFSSSVPHEHCSEEDTEQTSEDLPLVVQDDTHLPSAAEEANKTPQPRSAPTAPSSSTDPPTGESVARTKTEVVQPHSHGFSNAPSLARQGGWDSTRVTQLYLEGLTRGTVHKSAPLSVKFSESSSEPARPVSEGDASRRPNSLTDDPVLVPRFDDNSESDRINHRASLVLRDDWEHASPSIADWMQIAADDGTTLETEDDAAVSAHGSEPTPRVVTSKPQPPPPCEGAQEGLGLAIHVQNAEEGHSSPLPQPPAHVHSPPPPPSAADQIQSVFAQLSVEVSPSLYSDHPPSSIIPDAPVFPKATDHPNAPQGPADPESGARSSEESSLNRAGPTPSTQTLDSSAPSQRPSIGDQTSAEVKRESPSPEQRRLKKRRHVIKELVDTEYTFGRDMKVVEDIYKGTSSSCLDLSAEDIRTLFGNSDQIVQFSTTFQDALKQAAKSVYVMPKSQRWSSKRSSRAAQTIPPAEEQQPAADQEVSDADKDRQTFIGQAFMANMAQMEKVYTDYLKNHDNANKKLEALQKNPKVAIWLKECREWASDLTSAWNLDSLLVKPVQRILKYPLLLTELLDATPNDHPDREAIAKALEGVTNISVRINELKKRADLVGQVVGRKRKESDVRAGLSKAFGRRTEKLKQHVGLSDMVEDKEYDALAQRFNDNFFQLQVVMRDVEMYTREVQSAMNRFNDLVVAIEGFIDASQSTYAELESKWRRFRLCVREVMAVALPDHVSTGSHGLCMSKVGRGLTQFSWRLSERALSTRWSLCSSFTTDPRESCTSATSG